MSKVEIRKAQVIDHSEILTLLLKWFDELAIHGIPHLCGHTGVWLADLIGRHQVFIALIDNKIVGCIGLRLGFMPWNNEVPALFNDFLMTDINMREFGVADLLISTAKKHADEAQLLLMMGHFTGTDADLKDRYLRLKGFQYGGGNFFYKGGK